MTLGIFDVPGLRQPDPTVPGLHHFQIRFASIDDLFGRYEALASRGIVPVRSANHGPGTSFYYRDLTPTRWNWQLRIMRRSWR